MRTTISIILCLGLITSQPVWAGASSCFLRPLAFGERPANLPPVTVTAIPQLRTRPVNSEKINNTSGTFKTKNGFVVSYNPHQRQNIECASEGWSQPDIVFANLDPNYNSSEIENLLFQRLFFESMGLAKEYKDLLAAKAEKDITAFRAKVKKMGFNTDILLEGTVNGKLTVIIDEEAKRKNIIEIIKDAFIGRSSEIYSKWLEGYDEPTRKRLAEEFAKNRSFHFKVPQFGLHGLFTREGIKRAGYDVSRFERFFDAQGNMRTDTEEYIDELIGAFVDIKVLGKGAKAVIQKGVDETGKPAKELEISLSRDGKFCYLVEDGRTYRIDREKLNTAGEPFWQNWKPNQAVALEHALQESGNRIVPFGTADPTTFSAKGKQDYTNFGITINGKLMITDMSAQTWRNLERLKLTEKVGAVYLSHVHIDHFGGLVDLFYSNMRNKALGQPVTKMKIIAAKVVYEQAYDQMSVMTGVSRKDFEDMFPRVDTEIKGDREVINFSGIKEFNGVEMTLARTHKHPLPTYGFKIKTPSGTVAYLVDSVMPLKTDPYYNEFVEFFGGKDVDILIAENGVPPIHITPDQLAGTFPELAAAGRILTVHSAFQQAHKDLLRLNAFEPVKIETRTGREIYVQRLAEELSRLNAIPQLWKLTPEACRRFAVSGHEIVLEEGAVIYGEGNSPEEDPYVYVLLEGKINVVGVPVDIKPGSIIGEMAIMRKEIDPAMIKIESGLTIREKRNRAALRRLLDGGIPGLIKEEMIGGEKHYIWEITQWDDEAEQACRGKNATEDNKKFLRELFATAVNPPRNKTVVAEGQTRLLRVHKDTFVKLCASIDIREAVPGAKTRQLAALVAKYIDERLQARAVEDLFNGINTAAIRHGNPPTSRDVAGALQTQRGCLENI